MGRACSSRVHAVCCQVLLAWHYTLRGWWLSRLTACCHHVAEAKAFCADLPQSKVDIFLLDWEKPRKVMTREGECAQALPIIRPPPKVWLMWNKKHNIMAECALHESTALRGGYHVHLVIRTWVSARGPAVHLVQLCMFAGSHDERPS